MCNSQKLVRNASRGDKRGHCRVKDISPLRRSIQRKKLKHDFSNKSQAQRVKQKASYINWVYHSNTSDQNCKMARKTTAAKILVIGITELHHMQTELTTPFGERGTCTSCKCATRCILQVTALYRF